MWPGERLVDSYADLRHRCVTIGHGLSQKEHEADRWVAATALWLDLPLVAHDRIFGNVPGFCSPGQRRNAGAVSCAVEVLRVLGCKLSC